MRTDINLHSDFSVVPLCYLFSKFSSVPRIALMLVIARVSLKCKMIAVITQKTAVGSQFNLNISSSLLSGKI